MTLDKRQDIFKGIGMSFMNMILHFGLEQTGSTRQNAVIGSSKGYA